MTADELREAAKKIAAGAPPVSPAVKARIAALLGAGRVREVPRQHEGAA